MKTLKRNQIVVLVIALMLVSAGYLSYTGNIENKNTITTSEVLEEEKYAGIGDAKLVNANVVEENTEQVAMVPNEENNNKKNNDTAISSTSNSQENENNNTNMITTSNKTISKEIEEYFSSSKLNRETMYSQMIESYQKILESEKISEEQKSIAQAEIKNINEMKNKIMICENLIKNKGIEDLVIFVNDKSVNVIARAEKLEEAQIAQIQNIIQREMNSEIENIHISNK